MGLKKIIVRDTLQYSLANYIAMAVGVILSIASKAILGTVGAGYWAIMKVFMTYSSFSDLGVREAGLREMCQLSGAGEKSEYQKIQNNCFSFSVGMSVVCACLVAGIALTAVQDPLLKAGLLWLALLIVATQFYNFMLTVLRVIKGISVLSRIIIINILMVAVLSIAGAYRFGVVGFVAGTFLATGLSAFLAYRLGRLDLVLNIKWVYIWKMMKIGFPMVVAAYAMDTFLSVDSLMIGKMLGYSQLGLYTIGLMSIQQISTLGRFSHIVLWPHIQERFGASKTLESSRPLFIRSTVALMYFLPLIIGAVYFGVPVVVHYFIPKFAGGIPAMKILVAAYFFVAINEMSSSILFTINKQKQLVPIFMIMIVLAVGLNYLLIRQGWGIQGVAIATAIAYFLFFLALFFYGFSHLLARTQLIKMAAEAVCLFVYFALAIWLVDRYIYFKATWLDALVKLCVFAATQAPLLVQFEKREGILGMALKSFFRAFAMTPSQDRED